MSWLEVEDQCTHHELATVIVSLVAPVTRMVCKPKPERESCQAP